MQAQKLLLFALVAGLLILQLSSPALARPRSSRSTGGTDSTGDSGDDNGGNAGMPLQCLGSIFNFLITTGNAFIPQIGLGIVACELPCSAAGTTGSCVACITNAIPNIPIPGNLAGCS